MAGISFLAPLALLGLIALPALWWLLRATPPQPTSTPFPPLQLLARLTNDDITPVRTPWWLLLLRLVLVALIILAFAGPIWRASEPIALPGSNDAPLLLVIETDWASAADWQTRRNEAERIIDAAAIAGRPIGVIAVPQPGASPPLPGDRADALATLETIAPQPVAQDWQALTDQVTTVLQSAPWRNASVMLMTSGLTAPEIEEAIRLLGEAHPLAITRGTPPSHIAVLNGGSDGPAIQITAIEGAGDPAATSVTAFDGSGRQLASVPIIATDNTSFDGTDDRRVTFDLPLDLRNDIARIALTPTRHAGAVVLVDDSLERRRVGIVSGEGRGEAQPLLSGATYVERALRPTADVLLPRSGDVNGEIETMIADGAHVIVLVNAASLIPSTVALLEDWMARGGVLIRFASAGLSQSTDSLTPVPLRAVDRQLGGTLTWEEPQAIAPFAPRSPFAGLTIPPDVRIERQVLSEPGAALSTRTFAELADATPLVTGETRGDGALVLFHITADTRWSNLPLSGLFVEMLARLVDLSAVAPGALNTGPVTPSNSDVTEAGNTDTTLPPRSVLDGFGTLGPAASHVEGLRTGADGPEVTLETPPGFYGSGDAIRALNLFDAPPNIAVMDDGDFADAGIDHVTIGADEAIALRPALVALAVLLALADAIIVLVLSGALAALSTRAGRTAAIALMAIGAVSMTPAFVEPSLAQSSFDSGEPRPDVLAQLTNVPGDQPSGDRDIARLIAAANTTRFAYVLTGHAELDRRSREGLSGLSRILTRRTAFEPADPFAVDPLADELAFYPLLYWPMPAEPIAVSDALVARIDAYMNNGGTILFDTRDEANIFAANAVSPQTANLRSLLSALDIPPLEPVPDDHVLTKSFYLIDSFPGRYASGPLWVEALPDTDTGRGRPARGGDGVSPIMITGNDMASAWALSTDGRPLYATVPADPVQREFAFRSGVNIGMYVMTGNYKADQVHIPALLERLVQ